MVDQDAFPPRQFDIFKQMIQDDVFPEFKYFEPHPSDEDHELEFRLKPAIAENNVIGRYNPNYLNNTLIKLFKSLDPRAFLFTKQKSIDAAVKDGRSAREAVTSQLAGTGLAGATYASPDNIILASM